MLPLIYLICLCPLKVSHGAFTSLSVDGLVKEDGGFKRFCTKHACGR